MTRRSGIGRVEVVAGLTVIEVVVVTAGGLSTIVPFVNVISTPPSLRLVLLGVWFRLTCPCSCSDTSSLAASGTTNPEVTGAL